MKKLLIAAWIPLALLAVSCQRNGAKQVQPDPRSPEIRGELIDATPAPQSVPLAETSTNVAPKNKHPKPPSVQRRMVLAELTVLGQSNSASAAMPSGTAGTAADLAKTNLPSITSLAGANVDVPGYQSISFNILSGFDFSLTPEMAYGTAAQVRAQIPVNVQSLDGKDVAIQGFLLPSRRPAKRHEPSRQSDRAKASPRELRPGPRRSTTATPRGADGHVRQPVRLRRLQRHATASALAR